MYFMYRILFSDASSAARRKSVYIKSGSNNQWAPTSSAMRCTSPSFTTLSHSLSAAWQSLPHQASRDSLPVPALHLHWTVMSWQVFLLDSCRSAALSIWRVNERVYMRTSISVPRSVITTFSIESLKAHQIDWVGQF